MKYLSIAKPAGSFLGQMQDGYTNGNAPAAKAGKRPHLPMPEGRALKAQEEGRGDIENDHFHNKPKL
ncbi:hypothetical protein [Rhizobium ecuadorense]|uniref:hypothetical protein n=1 Tax=Rhizobium ecuadorense TaxID=1671795 RepID=UPI000AE5FADD|nr:hypothetical protein [Rhizobium ecuadorense]